MPTTVKSLEERLDDFSAEVMVKFDELTVDLAELSSQFKLLAQSQATTQAQLATVVGAMSTQQAQTAITNAKLEMVIDNLKTTQANLEATNTRLDSPERGLTAIGTKLESTSSKLDEESKLLKNDRLEFASFRGKTDAVLGFAKWIGVTATGALIAIILTAFAVARSAGSLEETVKTQNKSLSEIKQDISELRTKTKP